MPSIIGTGANDRLIGTESIDYIYGGLGDDSLEGRGGNDLLNGEKGNDRIYGGVGDDEIYGGRKGLSYPLPGETIGDGDDVLYGDGGSDKIYGGTGEDYLFGGSQNDKLYGDLDNDYLDGGSDNDYLNGEDGDDLLLGGSGSDILIANGVSDTGPWVDSLTGGAGLDWFVFEKNTSGADRIEDFTSGEDKVLLKASAFGIIPNPALQYSYYDPVTKITTGTGGVGHPLASSTFPGTKFYRLDPNDFQTVMTMADLGSATDEIVAVVQAEAPYTGADPTTFFPALFYRNAGGGYTEFAVLSNGAVPRNEVNSSGVLMNDFIIY
jgi:hypothetical protein